MEEAPSYKGDWTRQIAVCSGALAQHMAAACFSWVVFVLHGWMLYCPGGVLTHASPSPLVNLQSPL